MTKPTRDECLQWLDMSEQWIASTGKQREDDLIMLKSIRDMLAEQETAQEVCAELYQVLGALGAPANVLDNCFAVAEGQKPPHESLLPFVTDSDKKDIHG